MKEHVLVLIGEASIVASCRDVRCLCRLYEGSGSVTCDEFEGLGNVAAELISVWHLDVRHDECANE